MSVCPSCKADLTGIPTFTGACPHCGHSVPSGDIERARASGEARQIDPTGTVAMDRQLTIDATPTIDSVAITSSEINQARTMPGSLGVTRPATEGGLENGAEMAADRYVPTCDLSAVTEEQIKILRTIPSVSESDSASRSPIDRETQGIGREREVVIERRLLRDAETLTSSPADYERQEEIGRGGMGIVVAARQASIGRVVAVKMLKDIDARQLSSRRKFLNEAVITGELEHPNIIPIYDVARDESDCYFYSMKRVCGQQWDKVIARKSLEENLEILMKVADAVAFAHSRDVIHRDLKPENVHIGEYGEVLLMDFGLALAPWIKQTPGEFRVAGTPAYMSPEMATGPAAAIGNGSDIYLLGAILYEILTGDPPHRGKNVMDCVARAARNEIVPTERSGELVAIARRAMATRPQDRYPSVKEFQQAIRNYQAHTQSVILSDRAREYLDQARRGGGYETFARALFGFQEAHSLWDGNARAREGIGETKLAYSRSALDKGDLDLAASLLQADDPDHAPLLAEILAAQRERELRKQRLKTARRSLYALAASIILILAVSAAWIRGERNAALVARDDAVEARENERQQREAAVLAEQNERKQRQIAVRAQKDAEVARDVALDAQEKERQQRQLAVKAQKDAEVARDAQMYEAYVARIGLAAAKIEENAFDRAKEILDACPENLRDWEWHRLMHLCRQEEKQFPPEKSGAVAAHGSETANVAIREPIEAIAVSSDGNWIACGGEGGVIRIWDPGASRELRRIPTGASQIYALAVAPDGQRLAAGTNGRPGYVKIWNTDQWKLEREIAGHADAVIAVAWSRDGKHLLTGSYDSTARLWEVSSGRLVRTFNHDWWVWSVAFSPQGKRIVTASQDGSARVWPLDAEKPPQIFWGHQGPVYAAAFAPPTEQHPDGQLVATAGYDKRILLWEPEKTGSYDFARLRESEPAWYALKGHASGVRAVAFSSDGKSLVSSGNDNAILVWDLSPANNRLRGTIRGHGGRVPACAFTADGNHIVSGSHDGRVKVWDLGSYEEYRVLAERLPGHDDAVLGASFSPGGDQVISASRDRTARIWDIAAKKEIRRLQAGHDFLVSRSFFFPGDAKVLTSASDNTARIWDLHTGAQLSVLRGTGSSAAASLSSDGTRILTGSDAAILPSTGSVLGKARNWSAKVWDARAGTLLRTLDGHTGEVSSVAISPDGQYYLTGDADGRCSFWHCDERKPRWSRRAHVAPVSAIVFLPDGSRALSAGEDNVVFQWDLKTGQTDPRRILKHPDGVTSIALAADGRVLTACRDRCVRVWDLDKASVMGQLAGDRRQEAIGSVAASPDGLRAVTASAEGCVRLWDLGTLKEIRDSALLDPTQTCGMAWSAVFSSDGSLLLTAGGDRAQVWNIQDPKAVRPSIGFTRQGSVASARFSSGGGRAVTASWDNTARIWNAKTGLGELKLEGHAAYINDAAFSPDDSLVVTASDDKTARLWDARTGKQLPMVLQHPSGVRTAAFDPTGQRIVTSCREAASVWEVSTGKEIDRREYKPGVLCAAFSPDGSRIAIGGMDGAAIVLSLADRQTPPLELKGHTAGINALAFSPDGTRVVTGSRDKTAKIWELRSGKELLTLKGHLEEVTTVAFSPDKQGRTVLTGSWDQMLILWRTDKGW